MDGSNAGGPTRSVTGGAAAALLACHPSDCCTRCTICRQDVQALEPMCVLLRLQAADAEKSLSSAKFVVSYLDAAELSALAGEDSDWAALAQLYQACAAVCLEGAHLPLWRHSNGTLLV